MGEGREEPKEDGSVEAGGEPRATSARWPWIVGSVVAVLGVVGVARPAVRPYTLDLTGSGCINMFSVNSYSVIPGQEHSTTYIADDEIPVEWFGERVEGTLVSWSSGARFSADGKTISYDNTRKAGPCIVTSLK